MKKYILFLFALFSLSAYSQNPILRGRADPHMKVYNGSAYMSVGKDVMPKPGSKDFFITPWEIYSSDDLIIWKKECVIDPADTYLGKGYDRCWASDITSKGDKLN